MKIFPLLLASLVFLLACSEGDATFDTDDAEVVTVKAYMMKLGDSANTRLKQDTLLPADSIVFLANIEPSRSIRITEFYWQIDSSTTHSEFSYRTNVPNAGKHTAKFILLDRFSDTLQDSVTFWIAPYPVLDLQNWIPKNGTSAVPTEKELSFAWNVTIENPLAVTKYPFLLKCGTDTLADTLLSSPQFVYTKGFPALQRCAWTVFATDNFGRSSAQKIQSDFFTGKDSNEDSLGSAYAILDLPNSALKDSLQFKLFDSAGSEVSVQESFMDWNESVFFMGNLPAADYKVQLFHPVYSDYTSDTISFSVQSGKVTHIPNISLADTVKPEIFCADCSKDSLSWEDTLKFVIEEKGLPLFSSSIRVTFDGSTTSKWNFNEDSLFILTSDLSKSFAWHPLTISFSDRAGNYTSKSFFVEPGNSCVETLTEATIHVENSITIPIRNLCSNLTPKRFFWDIDQDGNWDGEMAADGDFAFKTFSGSLFHLFANEILVTILYESGATYKATFTLYVDGVSG
ncbi:MAG: hypothetical protein J6Z31_05540 [Fibrobacter sp.]|nr:hypothetical protein [Fibrobacter sp.]